MDVQNHTTKPGMNRGTSPSGLLFRLMVALSMLDSSQSRSWTPAKSESSDERPGT